MAAAGLVGFAGNELVAIYRLRVGHDIGSQALIADGLQLPPTVRTTITVAVLAGFPIALALASVIVAPAMAVYTAVLYFDLRARRDVPEPPAPVTPPYDPYR